MSRLTPPPIEYAEDYFFDLYKKQYGKTYLEDFPNLTTMARARLRHIKAIATGQKLLDIGCAYGAFLAEAKNNNFNGTGIDPSEEAVKYINETLGGRACQGFFPVDIVGKFHVITMWYVIEHFENPVAALQKVGELLEPGGVFAFSTPAASGISGRFFLKQFLEKSPADHWTIWDARYIKKILHSFNFSVKKIIITGHHPERFPLVGKYLQRRGQGFVYSFFMRVSKIFKLGDTFEVYAIKK
jgi:2-polyprenyl-3-methyl-5-hydroxy-6-metoxy-1,4-benzoquinol methylase